MEAESGYTGEANPSFIIIRALFCNYNLLYVMIQHCSAGLKPYLFIESPSVLVSSESVNWPGVAKGALR